jgi:hypothetical protein
LINDSSLNIQYLDAYSVILIHPSSFIFDIIKLLNPSLFESRNEIPFKGGSLSCPKIFISECEPFFQKKSKFYKGVYSFEFKMILFYFYFLFK